MLNVPEVVSSLCKLSDKVMNNYLTADEFISKAEDMLELKFPKAYKDRITRELPENINELESTGQASRVDEYVVSTRLAVTIPVIDTATLRHFDKKFPRNLLVIGRISYADSTYLVVDEDGKVYSYQHGTGVAKLLSKSVDEYLDKN